MGPCVVLSHEIQDKFDVLELKIFLSINYFCNGIVSLLFNGSVWKVLRFLFRCSEFYPIFYNEQVISLYNHNRNKKRRGFKGVVFLNETFIVTFQHNLNATYMT